MTRSTIICISSIVVGLMFAGQGYAEIDPETVIGAWLLDEVKGDITEDTSGNGNDGTLGGGPIWIDGVYGKALDFSGSSSYVDCGNAETLNVEVFSVSFWCNIPSTQSWNHIISRGEHHGGGNPGAVNWGVMMYADQATILYEAFNDTVKPSLSASTTTGEWHHVVATHDGATMQLYHDGQLAGTAPTTGILLDENLAFIIGAQSRAGGPSDYFDGSIDDVGYFSTILSPEDIEEIMNNGLASVIGGQPLARRPDPEDGAFLEQTWGSLSWSAGDFAVSHDVYVGENFDDVDNGAADTFHGNHASTTLIIGFAGFPFPDGLVPGTTYFWRIDEVNDADPNSPWKGDVWSFSVPAKTAYNPVPADGAKFIQADGISLSWNAGLDARLHTVYFGDNLDEVNNASGGAAQTVTTFTPGTLESDKTYYWRIDEFDPPATYKGHIWSFTTAGLGGGVKGQYYNGINFGSLVLTRTDPQIDFNWGDPGGPDPVVGDDQFSARWTGEVEAAFTETYTFYVNSDDGARLWIGGQQLVNNWTDHAATEDKGTIDLVADSTYSLQMEYYENGGGAVAELRWSSPRTPKQVIPQAALSLPIKAGTPTPANGAIGTSMTPILTWNPGEFAASHELYFAADADAVANATKASPQFKATKALGAESYDPGKLAWQTTYYWRVDEIDNTNPDSPWVGNIWTFTTADFLLVDDFESYNDIDPPEPASNRVFDKWIDGFGTTTNGALIGNDFPPYAEQTIVHGGAQSMICRYDNAGKTSEATLTLVYPRDWTVEGVTKLSLWVSGNSANAADRIFVAAGGTAVVYHDDTSATQLTGWNEWIIDLSAFGGFGVNLANVNTITIGIGTKNAPAPGGGTGTMYFDDIRLIR